MSAGDANHPALGFLRYLHAQPGAPRLFITNPNDHVKAMEQEMRIEVMQSSPFTCEL